MPKQSLPPLLIRQRAVEAVQARFAGARWQWGKADCAQVAAALVKALGWKLPRVPRYRTEAQAQERLAALGCETLPQLAASIGLPRIAPAAAVLGDLVATAGTSPLGTLGIAMGNNAWLGFHEDHEGLVTMRGLITTAWRTVSLPGEGRD